jgi:TRAP-type C4-dicarboxylate transport system permease small subunit
MATIDWLKKWTSKFLESIVFLLLISISVLSFSQIITRKVFGLSIPHADQILSMSVMYLAFIGAGIATLDERHIAVEILTKFVSEKTKLWFGFFVNIFSFTVSFVLYFSALEYLELQAGTVDFFVGEIKTTTMEWVMIPGFLVIAFSFLLNAFSYIISLFLKGNN